MADYKKMYGLLCRAADAVIDPMERYLEMKSCAEILKSALLEAEEIYVRTSSSEEENTAE